MNWLRQWWPAVVMVSGGIAFLVWFAWDNENKIERTKQSPEIISIDGCEYITMTSTTYYGYGVVSITHKGNCSNPVHQP